VAAGTVVVRDGEVLLILRATRPGLGLWSIPAGFVEYDEDPAVTAVRECYEETGLEVELTGLLDVTPGEGLPGEASFMVVYQGQVVGGRLQAGDDARQAGFFSPDNLPPLAFASTRRALEKWRVKESANG
jgi:8-oxo-dGTP diphosphatase